MAINTSLIIIIIVVIFAFWLIYNQKSSKTILPAQLGTNPYANLTPAQLINLNNMKVANANGTPYLIPGSELTATPHVGCDKCEFYKKQLSEHSAAVTAPAVTNVVIENDNDPYSDPIKKQDTFGMYDPLTYPQLRLPREVLEKYNEYNEKHGVYPGFNQSTQPLFDNPILNGLLIKQVDENEPFSDNVPSSVPLFRVKSVKNTNRFFYYIIDQRYLSKLELKIPLDRIKVNDVRYTDADFYGLPELFDGDLIQDIPIYPSNKFRVKLYKTAHFP